MEKRKRAPGGGRKPGEFGKLGEVISLRVPENLRAKLKRAADQNDRTLNTELIWRLNASFTSGDGFPYDYRKFIRIARQFDKLDAELRQVRRDLGMKSRGRK